MKHINKFFKSYINDLHKIISNLDVEKLNSATRQIYETIKKGNTIYVCGNGGSAAISNHYICDYLKLLRQKTKLKPKIISLSNNIETITAISNDLDYKYIFKYQAESLCKKGDIILIISSSGNSKNIKTIGFSGFDGGYLKRNCDFSIHINAKNYGISEDSHHILMHVILQYLINSKKLG